MHAKNRDGGLPVLSSDTLAITGRISDDFVKVKPNIKSFHDQVNCDINTIDKGAFAMGAKIFINTCQLEAPSILADSQISDEIPRKKFLSTNILNGIQMAQ